MYCDKHSMRFFGGSNQRNRLRSSLAIICITIAVALVNVSIKTSTTTIQSIEHNLSHRNLNTNNNNDDKQDSTQQPLIPHNIIFTYQYDILKTKEPPLFYQNVLKTITAYRTAWNDDDDDDDSPNIIILDDIACRKAIAQVEPRLVKHFHNEVEGKFRSDICRIAALFLYGGYYFDIDLEVVTPLILPPTTSFAAPERRGGAFKCFFQAFVAAAKGHPIVRNAIETLFMAYDKRLDVKLLGPETLRWAFDSTAVGRRGEVLLLEEFNLASGFADGWYTDVKRRCKGVRGCNNVVHDPKARVIYFWSRVMGAERYKNDTFSETF